MRTLDRALFLLAAAAVVAIVAMAVRGAGRSAARTERLARAAAAEAEDSAFADSVLDAAGPQNVETTLRPSEAAAPDRDPARIAWLLGTRADDPRTGAVLWQGDVGTHRHGTRSTVHGRAVLTVVEAAELMISISTSEAS